jgi:SAM-dependent methyltransferase
VAHVKGLSVNPDWFQTFFDGLAAELWRGAITPEQTMQEAEFLEHHLALRPGQRVLDVPCGSGRHAIALSNRGMRITGVDLSTDLLSHAKASGPQVEWVLSDMRALDWASQFDAAYCWGNSFAYFNYDQCNVFLRAVRAALVPGGRFILESGAVSESLLPVLQPERSLRIGDIDFHSSNTYDALDGRMDITYTFARGEQKEVKPIHQWVHSAAEIRRMLEAAGFIVVAAFGDIDARPFTLRAPHLIVLSERA